MNEWIATIPFGDVSWVAIVAFVVILILRGDLVPRRTYEAKAKDCDEWRAMALRSIDAANKALAGAEVTQAVVQALPTPPEGRPDP